eukprot:213029_1
MSIARFRRLGRVGLVRFQRSLPINQPINQTQLMVRSPWTFNHLSFSSATNKRNDNKIKTFHTQPNESNSGNQWSWESIKWLTVPALFGCCAFFGYLIVLQMSERAPIWSIKRQFRNSVANAANESDYVNRVETCPSSETIKEFLTPATWRHTTPGYYILTGPKFSGKTTVCRQVYMSIKEQNMSSPIVLVKFESKLENFGNAINAYPSLKTWYHSAPDDPQKHFKIAVGDLVRAMDEYNARDGIVPVLVLDGLPKSMDARLLNVFVMETKDLIDTRKFRVVFIASDGETIRLLRNNKNVQSRRQGRHTIDNDFDESAVKSLIECFEGESMDAETMKQYEAYITQATTVGAKRIGFIEKIIKTVPLEKMNGDDKKQKMVRHKMIGVIYDEFYSDRFSKAFTSLREQGVPKDAIKQVIDGASNGVGMVKQLLQSTEHSGQILESFIRNNIVTSTARFTYIHESEILPKILEVHHDDVIQILCHEYALDV